MDKVAFIQLDTNVLKMELANVLPSGNFMVFDEMVEVVHFSQDLQRDGFIKPARISETISILSMFKTLCDVNGVVNTIAIATHLFKDFKNHRSFFEEIYNTNGFKFKIMTNEEELQALYVGVINTLDIPKALIVDVSAGSTNLIVYNRRNILNQEVISMGAEALSQLFCESKDAPEVNCAKMVELFRNELKSFPWIKGIDEEFKYIGSGSAFRNMGMLSRKLKKYPLDVDHNYTMAQGDVTAVYDLIKTLDVDKARKIKGISSDSSDILVSGICIAKAVLDEVKASEVTISSKSALDGIMFNYAMPVTNEKPISDLLGFSLENNNLFYDDPKANARQVGELALILFRQLKVLHKLPRGYIKVLRIASIMHDSGKRIKFDKHTKNGFHVVLNSDVYGATHREMVLAAFVCACQDSNDFSLVDWVRYKDIVTEEDLGAIKKLAIIVRIAEALDRTHRGAVVDVSCDVLGDSVIMKTIVTTDASLEVREAMKAGGDFKRAYNKNLEVL